VPAAESPRASAIEALDLRSYLDVLVRRWRVIAIVTATALVLALGLSLKQDKEYVADSDVLLNQQAGQSIVSSSQEVYSNVVNAARNLNNEIKALQANKTRDAVAAAYDGPLDPDDVKIKAVDTASDIARFSVRATDPKAAADLVNTYVRVATEFRAEQRTNDLLDKRKTLQGQLDALVQRISQIRQPLTEVENQLLVTPGVPVLEARRDDLTRSLAAQLTPLETTRAEYEQQLEALQLASGLTQTTSSQVLSVAEVPTDPVAPKPVQTGILAVVVGLLLGVVLAFVRDSLDERIRGIEDLERAAPGLPTLAVVPESRETSRSYLAMRDDGMSLVAEAYRSLRTSVKFAGLDRPIQVIQVTSALQGEGKTTTVANLAEALAQGGERVAIVCCDLRRPAIHLHFGQSLTPGFTDVLLRDAPLATAMRQVSERCFLLPAGSPPPNPSELLSSRRASAVIQALAQEFDVVIIDSTPVLPVTDALVASRMVDAALVVVDTRTTKRKVLHHALERLEQVSAPVTGLVLLGTAGVTYGYGYAYAYAYGDGAPPAQGAAPAKVDARA
jgi:capsular exopolysaccharide synthesis family protein